MNNVKWIRLSQGTAALVDEEDYDWLNEWVWSLHSQGYAYRTNYTNKQKIYMHRLVNNTPSNMHTDHINQIRLDNRKSNLRTVTHAVNMANSPGNRPKKVYPSLPLYITWDKSRKKYVVKSKHLKHRRFNSLEEARDYALPLEKLSVLELSQNSELELN